MSQKLNIKAFFFNAKTDYLPYYKNFTINVERDASVKVILKAIQNQDEKFSYPELNLIFRINNLVVEEDTSVGAIIEKLGTTLQIDPAYTYRSNNGLIINNNDFMQSFEYLAPYATKEDKAYYKTLYALHYASETSHFDREYIGDAILILAHKMITEGSVYKKEILEAITTANSGLFDCEYENNLFIPQDHTTTIEALKEMATLDDDKQTSLLDMIKKRFSKKDTSIKSEDAPTLKKQKNIHSIENLEEKYIAFNVGTSSDSVLLQRVEELPLHFVKVNRTDKLSGATLLKENKKLAFKKAGATLLDAFDAGAQVLVVEDLDTLTMFKNNFSAIESVIGRQIIGLELISAQDFIAQANVSNA